MATRMLGEIIERGLQYDRSWGIYALGNDWSSPARIGQTQFENGGLLDEMKFVINGEQLGDARASYLGNDQEAEIQSYPEFLNWLIDEGWIE